MNTFEVDDVLSLIDSSSYNTNKLIFDKYTMPQLLKKLEHRSIEENNSREKQIESQLKEVLSATDLSFEYGSLDGYVDFLKEELTRIGDTQEINVILNDKNHLLSLSLTYDVFTKHNHQ